MAFVAFSPGEIDADSPLTETFFTKMATPVSAEEVGDSEATDTGSFLVTGWSAIFMGAAASLLALLDIPFEGRMINLSLALMMILVGVSLLVACRLMTIKRKSGH